MARFKFNVVLETTEDLTYAKVREKLNIRLGNQGTSDWWGDHVGDSAMVLSGMKQKKKETTSEPSEEQVALTEAAELIDRVTDLGTQFLRPDMPEITDKVFINEILSIFDGAEFFALRSRLRTAIGKDNGKTN